MSIYKSWDISSLSEAQRERYEIVPVGDSFHTGRTTFRVTCRRCGKILHPNTTDPSWWISIYEETGE